MSLVTLSHLNVQYGNRLIIEGASLTLQPQARMGLVGRNGTGKSSLLRIIAGTQQADAGTVDVRRGTRIGMLDQHPSFEAGQTLREVARGAFARADEVQALLETVYVDMADAKGDALETLMHRQTELEAELETLGGWSIEHQVDATLHGLGLDDEMFDRPADALSGGERSRLALACLLLESPDLLLLDEPTNHLDIGGRRWLEQFLADTFTGAVMVVSHDRWLLDRVCTQMVDIRRASLERYPGNYTQFLSLRAERLETESRAWEKQQDVVRREQEYIRKYKAGQRAKQARGRESRLKRMIDGSELVRPEREAIAAMRLPSIKRCGNRVVSAEEIAVQIGDKVL
ncbi:MAG TPA: ATP-binding cassette domain-containing protein, partial [Phycisphaerales bacterium]|nr:ATP-binding cassette domain-containing protein [Phycisphaerales bacterium]